MDAITSSGVEVQPGPVGPGSTSCEVQGEAPGHRGGAPVPSGLKLTATEIARDWGTSRAYVSRCIQRGCPVVSLEEARAWRVANSRYGVGYRSKKKGEGGDV